MTLEYNCSGVVICGTGSLFLLVEEMENVLADYKDSCMQIQDTTHTHVHTPTHANTLVAIVTILQNILGFPSFWYMVTLYCLTACGWVGHVIGSGQ
jgi:hypothetical protein